MAEISEHDLGARPGRIIRMIMAAGMLALALALFSPFVSPLPALHPAGPGTNGRRTLSALVMCCILTVGVIAPLLYISLLIAEDLMSVYRTLIASMREGEQSVFDSWRRYPFLSAPAEAIQNIERLTGTDLRTSIAENLAELGKMLVGQVTRIMTHALYALVQLAMILLCAFYFFPGRGRHDRLAPRTSAYRA